MSNSPWLQPDTSPLLGSKTTSSKPKWKAEKDGGFSRAPIEDRPQRNRMTQDMSDLINKAGKLAADSRIASGNIQRHRAKASELDSVSNRARKACHRSDVADGFPTNSEDNSSSGLSWSLFRIYSTLWPSIESRRKLIFLLGWTGSTIRAVSTPAFTFVLAKLLRLYSVPGGDNNKALMYSMIILGVAFVDAVSTYTYHISFEYAGQRWVDSIRSEAMRRILDQPRAFFDAEGNSISRLSSSLDRDAEEMRNLLGRFLALMWIVVVISTVTIVWAMITEAKMTAIATTAAPYIFGVTKAYAIISEKWERLCNDANEDAAAIFTEVFTNIKTVRALTLERHFISKYIKATNHALALGFRRAFFTGFFYGLSDSAGNFSIAMIFYVGSRLVVSGAKVDHIVQVFAMLIFAITNVAAILAYIPQIGASKDTASRLLRLARLPEDSHEHVGEAKILGVGNIVFSDFRFAYPSRPEQTVLKNFNLLMQPGVCTAIVGGSGSGKSTIANLLLKLHSTADKRASGYNRLGDLVLAGRDIKRVDTDSLRSLVVPVSQTPTIFSATIYENIAYGLSADSPYNHYSSVSAAAQQAGIHDFVNSLPHGYTTAIGEGGMGLSGGQAQRIAIARALVRKPAVLIFDEATSALDLESANMVRQTIESLVKHQDRRDAMTVIIITHSREMMEIAEKVVVLDQGTIVEEGSFEQLLERKGALTNLLSGGEWTG